jgi:ubiquitin-activating enzyme E1
MGVKSVTLYDPTLTSPADLSSQFFLGPADVGLPRAARCVAKLAELNQYVRVGAVESLLPDDIARYHIVVAANEAIADAVRLNDITRAHGHKFIAAETRGVFGRIFVDLGPVFRVEDTDGEPPVSFMVGGVSSAAPGVVATLEDVRHNLEDGAWVTFSEVEGMTQLNGSAPRQIKSTGPYTFR